jgi:hypothetical protein
MAPGRILESLVDRHCASPRPADACRALLFAWLQERLALPEGMSAEAFWSLLKRVDAEFDQRVTENPRAHADAEFPAVHERFREARRELVGADLDERLFGLSDALLQLPQRVEALARDSRMPLERKLLAYQEALQRLEDAHGVRLLSVVEPVELAKHELRLRETAHVLGAEQRSEVLARYTGPEYARRYLEHQREHQARSERLKAFNQEREALLKQLASEPSPQPLRQRMLAVDERLLEKYDLR